MNPSASVSVFIKAMMKRASEMGRCMWERSVLYEVVSDGLDGEDVEEKVGEDLLEVVYAGFQLTDCSLQGIEWMLLGWGTRHECGPFVG